MMAQFDQDALDAKTLLDGTTGQRGLFALPMGRYTNHAHVWRSLLEQAGFTLADIPKEWEAFWSFWCDQVQPAVRKVTGRHDIYGVGLHMSAEPNSDTRDNFLQFMYAYEADYVSRDGRLMIEQPQVRDRLVKALDSYIDLYRIGCTPPNAIDWDNASNNKAFLAQTVVMTVNNSLSIPGALRATRPEDYFKNSATILWPDNAYGRPLAMMTKFSAAAAFRDGGHAATAKEFVRFLVAEGWLAHWLSFAGDRYLPPFTALLQQPFWLDPGDPHRMAAAMQFLTRPHDYDYAAVSGEWRHQLIVAEGVWTRAVRRAAAEGVTAEQAIDEAIARVKQILSE
jgi:multiple sugar transport system substrate-binding protein